MERKNWIGDTFLKVFEQTLFKLKVLSIWRLQYFLAHIKTGTVKRMELKNNTTGCFTE